jgi:hypothetical protein
MNINVAPPIAIDLASFNFIVCDPLSVLSVLVKDPKSNTGGGVGALVGNPPLPASIVAGTGGGVSHTTIG